jgi:hypothetical protein
MAAPGLDIALHDFTPGGENDLFEELVSGSSLSMNDVFPSHKHAHKTQARPLAERLKGGGGASMTGQMKRRQGWPRSLGWIGSGQGVEILANRGHDNFRE